MESAFPHPDDEDDDDLSTEAPSVAEPGGVISKLGRGGVQAELVLRKRGKDPYEQIEKLQKELAKLEAYRKVDQCLEQQGEHLFLVCNCSSVPLSLKEYLSPKAVTIQVQRITAGL